MAYRQNNSQGQNDRVRFDLMERIGVLSRKENGWAREVNIVAWNDGPGKVDIREWDPDHKRMTKGVTLFEDEAERLAEVLARRYGLIYPGDSQDRSFSDEKPGYTESAADENRPHGRTFGELTAAPRENTYNNQAGASAGEAAEGAAGQDGFFGAAPAAAAASMPEAAACVAESTEQMDAAAPATV